MDNHFDQVPLWLWVLLFIIFLPTIVGVVVLFPIVFKPWWMAIISGLIFFLLVVLFYPGRPKPE